MSRLAQNSISYKLREYPLLAVSIAMTAGILVGYMVDIALWITVVACVICAVAMFFTRKNKLFTALAAVFFISLGCGLITFHNSRNKTITSDENGIFQLLLTDYPLIKDCSVSAECQLVDTDNHLRKVRLTLLRDSLSQSLVIGDVVLVSGKLAMPHALNPEGYDYGKYLRRQGYSATIYAQSWRFVRRTDEPHSLRAWGRRQQYRVKSYYISRNMKPRELGVICALTIGERDMLDADTKNAFSAAGAMHVLAVSGLHVGIIYAVLICIFTVFGCFKPRRDEKWLQIAQSSAIIFALWAYAVITGLSPSVVRATLMFSLGEIGRGMHRTDFGLNVVGTSAMIILLVNPLSLFSVSFQLSYAAVFSIMTIGQWLDRLATGKIIVSLDDSRWKRACKKILRYFIGILTISLAAQIGTLPLTLYYFHQFSVWFWLTNLFVLPFAEFIAFYSLVLLPCLPAATQYVYQILCNYVCWIESLPHSTLLMWIDFTQMLLLFGIIIAAYNRRWHYAAAVFVLVFTLICVWQRNENHNRKEMIVYADRKADIIQIVDGTNQTWLTNDSARAASLTKTIGLKYHLSEPVIDTVLRSFTIDEIGKVVVLTDSLLQGKRLPNTMQCDLLVLGDIGHVGAKRLLNSFEPKRIILLGTMKSWKRRQFAELCSEANIPYHDVMTEGAFIYKFE